VKRILVVEDQVDNMPILRSLNERGIRNAKAHKRASNR
jgi:hypothetical protein